MDYIIRFHDCLQAHPADLLHSECLVGRPLLCFDWSVPCGQQSHSVHWLLGRVVIDDSGAKRVGAVSSIYRLARLAVVVQDPGLTMEILPCSGDREKR